MLILLSSIVLLLGVVQGVTGEECPPVERLQCLSIPTRCMRPDRASITLADGTICQGCAVCTDPPRPDWRARQRPACPLILCPMWVPSGSCDVQYFSQWIRKNDVICYVCGTYYCK